MTRARPSAPPSRVRDPRDVPTPLAIALATFCRLSGRSAEGDAVRDALACLLPEEDGRLEAFLATADTSIPLGPLAVVEVVRGRSPSEASAREVPAKEAHRPPASRSPPRSGPPATGRRSGKGAILPKEGIGARPTVRKVGDRVPRVRPSAPVPPPLPKRGARRPPRGRLSAGTPAHRDRAELETEKGRLLLKELIQAHRGHGPTLLRRLNDLFGSTRQRPLQPSDLEDLLVRHDLVAELEAVSLERLRLLLQQHRGDLGRVAAALKTSRDELRRDLERRGQWDSFERARDRYRRDVFAKPMAEQAFLLLRRRGQLADLGALAPLEKALGEASRAAWQKCQQEAVAQRRPRFARLLAISEERAGELLAHFGLSA